MLVKLIDEEGEVLVKADRTEEEVEVINKMIRYGVDSVIKEKKPRTVTKATEKEAREVIDLYNVICIDSPRALLEKNKKTGKEKTSDNKKKLIGAAIKSGVDFKELFIKVSESDFLCGRKGDGRKFGFDWILKPQNRQKILEGCYDNHEPSAEKEKTASFNIADLEAAAMARYKK